MSSNQILLRIQHYHYDVHFGALDLAPLTDDIVITTEQKTYDGRLFDGESVNEKAVLLRDELKIRVTTKYIAGIVPLLQRLVEGAVLPEEELQLLSRHPQGITLEFPCTRLIGCVKSELNTENDQSVTLEFLARADTDGKVLKIG